MEQIPVDPRRAFTALRDRVASDMASLYADIAAKDAYIEQLMEEIEKQQERLIALEQNKETIKQSGADIKKMEHHPSVPQSLRKVVDNPQA